MLKVKTFACPLQIFRAKDEMSKLDQQVNQFIRDNNISQVVSVSDACTTDDTGATIGLIRVMTYQEG